VGLDRHGQVAAQNMRLIGDAACCAEDIARHATGDCGPSARAPASRRRA
jgi:hypothetical protein